MDDGLKQRLIGAIVLLALAVIFIPIIFDREKIAPVDKQSQIPPVLHIEVKEVKTAKPTRIVEAAKSHKDIFLPDETKPIDESSASPSLSDAGIPNAWILQVASFLHQHHADELRNSLVEAGYSAYTRKFELKSGPMIRVYIGPKLDKNRLLEDKKKIEAKYKTESLILKYEP